MQIIVEKPTPDYLKKLDIKSWPIWEKEASTFPWHYDEQERCYLLQGRVIVTPQDGDPVEIQKGDFVVFPQGMSCTWEILEDVRKHYNFG